MYLRIINNEIVYPYSIQKLRQDNYNVSFPTEMTEPLMREWDIYEVRPTPKPNDYTKNISEVNPVLVDGNWIQTWNQIDASQSEIDSRIENKWQEVRNLRDELLTQSDWTQLSDVTANNKSQWITYRQELRAVPEQNTFPYTVIWPTMPT